MVDGVRAAEKMMGQVDYQLRPAEQQSRMFRRSLFVVSHIKTGEVFTAGNLRSIRPGYGLHTRHFNEILGRTATRDIERGTPLAWEMIGGKCSADVDQPRRSRVRGPG
jgi:pseudaminic acid synthase